MKKLKNSLMMLAMIALVVPGIFLLTACGGGDGKIPHNDPDTKSDGTGYLNASSRIDATFYGNEQKRYLNDELERTESYNDVVMVLSANGTVSVKWIEHFLTLEEISFANAYTGITPAGTVSLSTAALTALKNDFLDFMVGEDVTPAVIAEFTNSLQIIYTLNTAKTILTETVTYRVTHPEHGAVNLKDVTTYNREVTTGAPTIAEDTYVMGWYDEEDGEFFANGDWELVVTGNATDGYSLTAKFANAPDFTSDFTVAANGKITLTDDDAELIALLVEFIYEELGIEDAEVIYALGFKDGMFFFTFAFEREVEYDGEVFNYYSTETIVFGIED